MKNNRTIMLAYTYIEKGKFALVEKPKPTLIEPSDAIVRVTMSSICTSDLHIKHGSVPRAVLALGQVSAIQRAVVDSILIRCHRLEVSVVPRFGQPCLRDFV